MQSQSSNILEKGLVGFLGDKIISNTTTTKIILFLAYIKQKWKMKN
ncbi:lipoprotein [Clostridium botulinum A1 str. CFSAN002368]|nr:lipoprotein [Clostridium botulinum A1 str. CFSAN002368]